MSNKKFFLSLLILLITVPVFGEINDRVDEETMIANNVSNSHSPTLFKIAFNFSHRESDDLNRINEILSTIPLSYVDIDNNSGYLATAKYYDQDKLKETTYRYGFDKISFICAYDKQEEKHYYQLDTSFFAKDKIKNIDMLNELWYKEHPEYIISMVYKISRNDGDVFVILYHDK